MRTEGVSRPTHLPSDVKARPYWPWVWVLQAWAGMRLTVNHQTKRNTQVSPLDAHSHLALLFPNQFGVAPFGGFQGTEL